MIIDLSYNFNMKINIRKIEPKDKDKLFVIMREFYSSNALVNKPSDDIIYKDIDESLSGKNLLICYLLFYDDNLAGYTMLTKCFSTDYGGVCMWIEDIYIKKEYRGIGLGKEIFSFIEKEYGNEIVRYKLEVEKNNINAIGFYKRQKFNNSKYITMTKEV